MDGDGSDGSATGQNAGGGEWLRPLHGNAKRASLSKRGCSMMAKCNATTLISSGPLGMTPPLFAQNVGKTSRPRLTMRIVSARTEQQDTVRIAKSVALKAEEKIGQGQCMRLSLQQMRKLAKFAMLTSRLKSFMQTAVLQTVQKNTVAAVSYTHLTLPTKRIV